MKSLKPFYLTAIFALLLPSLIGCNAQKSDVMRQLFSVDTTNQFYITLPDQKTKVVISEFVESDNKAYAKGISEINKNYSVLLDYRNMIALNTSNDEIFWMVAPYIIVNNEVGPSKENNLDLPNTSTYLGLFELNYKTYAIKQIDSQLVGVDITVESIRYDGQKNVQLKIRPNTTESNPSNVETVSFDVDKHITPINIGSE